MADKDFKKKDRGSFDHHLEENWDIKIYNKFLGSIDKLDHVFSI